MNCPSCHREVENGAVECPWCGIVFAKWRRPTAREVRPGSRSPSPPSGVNPLRVLILALLGGVILVGGYWYLEIRPRQLGLAGLLPGSAASRSRSVKLDADPGADFDRRGRLPIDPRGAASNGSELLVANRKEPGGYLRLTPAGGDKFEAEVVQVIESTYRQSVAFRAVAWNGSRYVGYADGSWFQASDDQVFVLHEPGTLAIERIVPAPPGIGCLAWDGSGYWAGTRKNTRQADEEAWLYRLSPEFEVIERHRPPGDGCQGLAWDGRRLWWADVFTEQLLVLDVSGPTPHAMRRHPLRIDYPSGLAWDGSALWMVDYDDGSMQRLNPRFRAAWSHAGPAVEPEGFGSPHDEFSAAVGEAMGAALKPLGTEEFAEIMDRLAEGGEALSADETAHFEERLGRLFEAGTAGSIGAGDGPVTEVADLGGVWEGSLTGDEGRWTVIVTDEVFFVQGPRSDAWVKGTVRIDSSEELPILDLKIRDCDCPYRGRTVRALYQVEGGRLTLASGEPGDARPTSLEPSERIRVLRMTRLDGGKS